jgi:ABC-type polysaccharide/polyol phosphate export permease
MKIIKEKALKKYWIMIWEMARANFKMKDQGTFLGFLWTLLHPLIYFLVLYGLFNKWMGNKIPDFPLYLIIGIVQWNFFVSGTNSSITAISSHGSYIKNTNFPRSVLVVAPVLAVIFSHLLELLILVVFWLIVIGHVSITAIGLVPLLVINTYLVLSVAFVLATIGVYFLDIGRIWGIFTSIGLFITPIFYSLDLLDPQKRTLILLNPMTHVIKATREILIDGKFPELGGLVYVIILSTFILVVGLKIFHRAEGDFAEKI